MQRRPRPPHPAVDWSTEKRNGKRWAVQAQCPECEEPRYIESRLVAERIDRGVFTGRCLGHQMPGLERHGDRPPHPAVEYSAVRVNGRLMSRVTCPKCGEGRGVQTGGLSGKIRAGTFTGLCLPCSPHAPQREWKVLGPGRKLDPVKGYIRLQLEGVAPEERWMYDAMREHRTHVLEHRMAMARALGRPLTKNELVDHRDGVKTNNDPSNLRLYRRGMNDDGSGCGYGTYYDEWQRAEAEVRRLTAELTVSSACT